QPTNRQNPYALYQQLRTEGPVRPGEANGWVVTGYAAAQAALHDARLSAERMNIDLSWLPAQEQARVAPVARAITRQMLWLDAPDHTRLRSLVTKAFTPRVLEAMRARIQAIVDDLLDQVQAAGRMDVIRDVAYPLPAIVIAELLGVPPADRDRFKEWSDAFVAFLDGGTLTPETALQALLHIGDFVRYFHTMVQERRVHPRDDLLQALIAAEERGDTLSEEELLTNCVLLLAAGHETTTNLIGNGLLALLRNPDQLQQLAEDPSLAPSAINELLRFDSPVQLTDRIAIADLTLGGMQVSAGQYVTVVLGAANRDPAQFPDPDRLDLRRQDNRHLAFGYGSHFCLGAALARMEGQIAFTTMLRRLSDMRLATEDLSWRHSVVFRALEALPITFA
ncbi:MAG TPA: cytochrome P450, partial [Chloroflexota bacterium]|nr:cytochrome P450 [Chloroflexota bacterium]